MSSKPKGPVPSLIGASNGKPTLVHVERKSTCKRCKTAIEAGQDCIAIPKLGGAHASPRRFCHDCFRSILAKTQADLNGLQALLING